MISKEHVLHPITPYDVGTPEFIYWENEFTSQELDVIQKNARNVNQEAIIGSEGQRRIDNSFRSTKVGFAIKNQDTEWLYNRLSHVISSINAKHFSFDLTGFAEPFQLANYTAEDVGHYDWHQDSGTSVVRKLSLVLQLTDASEYEGGNLELYHGNYNIKIKKQRGLIVVFPSYCFHRVTPVTYGERQSLVSWICGPKFR